MLPKIQKSLKHFISRSATLGFGALLILFLSFIVMSFLRYRLVVNQNGNRILVQRRSNFAADADYKKAVVWLAQRWSTAEENIYLINEDSEPWMRIIGLVDVRTLSSAKIWIIDSNYEDGLGWISILTNWNTPHYGHIYLESEYRPPSEAEQRVASQLYSSPTYWRENYFGNLAILTGLKWTDSEKKTGEVYAYQSEKNLPSITIPVENGMLKKWNAYHTPIVD
jgi:hypothetical protein